MEITQDAEGIATPCRQPVPPQPFPRRRRPIFVGEIRIPLAGPYAPRARLVLFPDGRMLWRVRLWERDRAVPHVVGTDVLRQFARVNRLFELERRIEALVVEASHRGRR